MPEGARVDSVETLKAFKVALWKFQEAAQRALGDAESDATRLLMWVENEQDAHWQGQIRKAEQNVVRCKEAVRMKKIFKDASGRQQSAVDEEKALQIAVRRLAEAQSKHALVRKWVRQLQKEIELYKGGVQRFTTTVFSEIPNAAAHLESLAAKLDAYLSVQPAEMGSAAGAEGSASAGPSMNRGGVGLAAGAELPWSNIPYVPDRQWAKVSEVEIDRQPTSGDLPVLIHLDQEITSEPVRIEHDESAWKITSVGNVKLFDEARSVRVDQLIAARPDLAGLLSLPVGFSGIMDSAGIVEVLDPGRQPVWQRRDPGDRSEKAP